MSTLKVLKVGEKPKEFESKFGTMYTWTVQGELDGEPDIVQITTKKREHGLTIGETINGTVEVNQYGTKFKREQQGYQPRQGGFTPRTEDPEKQAMIVRQNALTNAVQHSIAVANIFVAEKKYKEAHEALAGAVIVEKGSIFARFSLGELRMQGLEKHDDPVPEPEVEEEIDWSMEGEDA